MYMNAPTHRVFHNVKVSILGSRGMLETTIVYETSGFCVSAGRINIAIFVTCPSVVLDKGSKG